MASSNYDIDKIKKIPPTVFDDKPTNTKIKEPDGSYCYYEDDTIVKGYQIGYTSHEFRYVVKGYTEEGLPLVNEYCRSYCYDHLAEFLDKMK